MCVIDTVADIFYAQADVIGHGLISKKEEYLNFEKAYERKNGR